MKNEIQIFRNEKFGAIRTTITPKVTGKGQQYFINKFLGA